MSAREEAERIMRESGFRFTEDVYLDLLDRIEALEAALRKYGMHDPNCYPPNADGKGALCICGLTDALSGGMD